jgi:proteasome lid subunit RPN8/RPN11
MVEAPKPEDLRTFRSGLWALEARARRCIKGTGAALCPGMGANGDAARAVVSPRRGGDVHGAIDMPAALCLGLLRQAAGIHRAGLKSYGLLIAEPGTAGYPFTATGVVFLDSRKNRRNDPGHRAAFRAQGEYFRQFDDAGFVADPTELLAACRAIEDSGQEIVAPFHSHRRQPANFSLIDYRLHNPAFAWHLIISLRDPHRPVLQPFRVAKEPSDFGISDQDARQGSELAYTGPEVTPLALAAHGSRRALRRLTATVHPATAPAGAGRRARPPDPSDQELAASHEPVPG